MSAPSYTIQNAKPEDTEAIIKMHARSWLDTYPNDAEGVSYEWIKARTDNWSSKEKLTKRKEKINQARHDPSILYKIAKDTANAVVGMAMASRDEAQTVGAVYVDKEYYGTGMAQRLMDAIIEWADPSRPLELEVATYNQRARAFYRKYGFKEIPGSEYYYDVIPVVKMVRKGDK